MKLASCLVALSIVAPGCSGGAASPDAPVAAESLAPVARHTHPADAFRDTVGMASLQDLRHMTVSGKAGGMWPRPAADIDRAQVGDAERLDEVSCAALAAYRQGDDARSLLVEKDAVYYPVSVDGEVVSSIAMGKRPDGAWEVVGIGRPSLAKAIDDTGKRLAASRGVAEHALVEIRSLHLRFLADEAAGRVTLTALEDVAEITLAAGQSAPASEVFAKLAPRAAKACSGGASR